jgi:hypothetical protein
LKSFETIVEKLMDYESIIEMPVIGEIIYNAIDEGNKWGKTFTNDVSWSGNRDRMANHAVYESTLWSVGNGIGNGFLGLAGIPTDIVITLYSQVKLASALFTIYDIDVTSHYTQPLVLAAAAEVSLSELVEDKLKTRTAKKAIQKSLMNVPSKTFRKINKVLGIKLISKTSKKTLLNAAKIIPFIEAVFNGTINGVMMNNCGHSVIAFIKAYQNS